MYLHMNNRLFSRNDLVRLIIPLIVDQFLQVAVGLSDSIMVARVGEAAVSGVSLVDTVMLLIINIFNIDFFHRRYCFFNLFYRFFSVCERPAF